MKFLKLTVTVVLVIAAMSLGNPAFSQGRGSGKGGGNGGGNGGGSGGGPGEETSGNNLSVPAIFVPVLDDQEQPIDFQSILKLSEEVGTFLSPDAAELDQVPYTQETFVVPGLYYVQGVHRWQADSVVSDIQEPVTAAWGDNLAVGDARLKVGSPIRVEVGLLATLPPEMTGWEVIKLENLLDRLAYYGTLASEDPEGGYTSNDVKPYPEVRVYDAYAWLTIYYTEDPNNPIPIVDVPATAEVNSTGRIVYGYNLRVSDTGSYKIVFTAPNVMILGANAGDFDTETGTLELEIKVGPGGGKGGGKKIK